MKLNSKLFVLPLLSAATGSILQLRSAACNADNCLRAISGKASSIQASYNADCSSFMEETVTPIGVPTVTVTSTYTTYSIVATNFKPKPKRSIDGTPTAALVAPRQITQIPSLVPTYASACSGTARYSSACSCEGITRVTSSVATATVTVAATTTIAACDPAENYNLLYTTPTSLNLFDETPPTGTITEIFPNMSPAECCLLCHTRSSPGCWGFQISLSANQCALGVESGGVSGTVNTDYCPWGVYTFTTPVLAAVGQGTFAVGPCGVLS